MTTQDLWRCTVENGVYQSWEEFSGSMSGYSKPFRTPAQSFSPLSNTATLNLLSTNIGVANPDGTLANIGTGGAGAIEYAKLVGLPY